MKLEDFEQKIWKVENIRIVIRADEDTMVQDYGFKNAATEGWRANEWLQSRVQPKIGDYQIVVVSGNGQKVHKGVLLRNLRATYEHK